MMMLDSHRTQICSVVVIPDDSLALEDDENFIIVLQDPMIDGVFLGRTESIVTITDDDGMES